MVSLQLHLSFTPSPLKLRRPLDHKLPLHAPPRLFSSANRAATTNGYPGKDVLLNGAPPPPAHYAKEDSAALPAGLQRELMPRHVAIIMDGNRRWARTRALPIGLGYEAGFRALRRTVDLCCKWGIRVLTVFAFSTDNWFRPKVETDFLLRLFERALRDELQRLVSEDVRISLIGDSSKLVKPLQVLLTDAVVATESNSRLHLILAVNYSGQSDVVQACQKLAVKVEDGLIEPEDIDEVLVEKELGTNCTDFPYPDLLIRTSGELRISNFLLWQLAHTELYFSHSLWPDFGEDEFLKALCSFQERQRRFGC
ncbi:hypothetical protein ACS0TY_015492 [Phlomoides rotata]